MTGAGFTMDSAIYFDDKAQDTIFVNERMPVIPTITTYGPIALAWGTSTKALSASTYPLTVRVAGLRLPAGTTDLTITGENVRVIVEYREATL